MQVVYTRAIQGVALGIQQRPVGTTGK